MVTPSSGAHRALALPGEGTILEQCHSSLGKIQDGQEKKNQTSLIFFFSAFLSAQDLIRPAEFDSFEYLLE